MLTYRMAREGDRQLGGQEQEPALWTDKGQAVNLAGSSRTYETRTLVTRLTALATSVSGLHVVARGRILDAGKSRPSPESDLPHHARAGPECIH